MLCCLYLYVNRNMYIVFIVVGVLLCFLEVEMEVSILCFIFVIIFEVGVGILFVVYSEVLIVDKKECLNELLLIFSCVWEIKELNLDVVSNLMSLVSGFIVVVFEELVLFVVRNSSLFKEEVFDFLIYLLYGIGKLLIEKKMFFGEMLECVVMKGGIIGEGVEVIYVFVLDVFDEVFERILKKYKLFIE